MPLSNKEYSTQDLDMAAWLSLLGYPMGFTHDGESSGGHPIGSWVFTDHDERLEVNVEKFANGMAMVNPSEFYEEINKTRNALFKFLGIPIKRPQRS